MFIVRDRSALLGYEMSSIGKAIWRSRARANDIERCTSIHLALVKLSVRVFAAKSVGTSCS
jgi:hypothetical protein